MEDGGLNRTDIRLSGEPDGPDGRPSSSFNFLNFRLKEGHCTLFFCHSHSHSHNDIGNVYLLFLSKATG